MITAYQVFGLTNRATEVEVRKAYRLKMKQLHPDTCGDDAIPMFLEARRAFGILVHPDLRRTLAHMAIFPERLRYGPHEIQTQTAQVLDNFSLIQKSLDDNSAN